MSKSPSLRRIQADIRELSLDPSDRYHAAPLENDMFEWHFTIRGADGTDFAGGIYHGRILLPPEYPFKPPHIMFLTPSGRFETNTKICLSFSAYHPELWQPAWGIRLILEALISFLPTPADGAIGAVDWSPTERKRLAAKSCKWECPLCGKIADLIPKEVPKKSKNNRFQKEIEQLQRLQMQEHNQSDDDDETEEEEENGDDEKNKGGEEEPKEEKEEGKETAEEAKQEESDEPKREDRGQSVQPDAAAAAAATEQRVDDAPTQPAPRTHAPAPPVAQDERETAQQQSPSSSWLLDPALQIMIVILSVICYLLFRKITALLDDIQALE